MLKELDRLAILLFSEMKFNTCSIEMQEIICKEYKKRKEL
jgi:hypothetical protein